VTGQRREVDLLVLGGGMAGLSAAAAAAAEGRTVILVEVASELGGTARHAGFVWTAPTLEILREVNPGGDARLGERLVEDFDQAVDWVRSLGVACLPAVDVLTFGRGHQIDTEGYLRACEGVVRSAAGCEILLRAEPRALILANGAVLGAEIVLQSGEARELRATETLLATGGFQADPELRASLIHPLARELTLRSNPHSKGDGLRLGLAAGAQFGYQNAAFYGHLMPYGVPLNDLTSAVALTLYYSEHGVLLNLEGRRFMDETVGDHLNAIALLEQPEARALLIADSRVREEFILAPYVEGIEPIDCFDAAYKRGARCAVAEDLDELRYMPEEWGYDGDVIRRAILEFNDQCAAGTPQPPRRFDARPLDRPPFYIIETWPAITYTFGGLLIDSEARVLDGHGEPIPGVLAAGADAGGLFMRAYAGGLASALVFGLRAARTAIDAAAAGARRGWS